MRTVTVGVCSRAELNKRMLAAFGGEVQGASINFETPELLFKVLSGKRWELLNMMAGAGEMTLREAARRANRDVKAVHTDVHALLNAGILSKAGDGRIVFPFDALHVDFMLQAA